MTAAWRFSTDFDDERRARLETFNAFEKVVDRLLARVEIVDPSLCEGNELGPPNCWRPEAVLVVDSEAFDAFFNSPRSSE